MKLDGVEVDFDLGAEGQINGVDPWKLWHFLEDSNIKTSFSSSKEVEAEVKKEVAAGNMTYSVICCITLAARYNKAIKNRQQAGWTSAVLLGLCFHVTASTNKSTQLRPFMAALVRQAKLDASSGEKVPVG